MVRVIRSRTLPTMYLTTTRRILESEKAIHEPAAVLLAREIGDVPSVLGEPCAARVGVRLLEGAELRRAASRDTTRRDIQTQIHVAEARPVVARHLGHAGGPVHAIERRPLEHRAVCPERRVELG